MKKFLALSCLALLGLSQTTQAQSEAGIYGGVTYSINSTWLFDEKLWDDPNYKTEKTWKSSPGAVLGFKFNESNSLQVEYIAQKQGADYTIVDDFDNEREIGQKRIELKYTAIPVLYKYTTTGKTRFNFHIGPQFSFLKEGSEVHEFNSDGNVRITTNSTDVTVADVLLAGTGNATLSTDQTAIAMKSGTKYERAKKDSFNDSDVAIAFGLGMEFDIISGLYLSTNLRFNYGFNDIRNDDWVKMEENRDYYDKRNNVVGGLQVGLHYIFKY